MAFLRHLSEGWHYGQVPSRNLLKSSILGSFSSQHSSEGVTSVSLPLFPVMPRLLRDQSPQLLWAHTCSGFSAQWGGRARGCSAYASPAVDFFCRLGKMELKYCSRNKPCIYLKEPCFRTIFNPLLRGVGTGSARYMDWLHCSPKWATLSYSLLSKH